MRLTTAILILSCCTHFTVIAQQLFLKGGMNASTITKGYQNTLLKSGAIAGIGVELPLSRTYFVQFDLHFIQKGYKGEYQFGGPDYGVEIFDRKTLVLNYLEVPYFLKFRKEKIGNVSYSFFIGQSIGFCLGGMFTHYSYVSQSFPPHNEQTETTTVVEFDESMNQYPIDTRYSSIQNRFEMSFLFGGQVEFYKKVMIDIRYGLGLTNLYHSEAANTSKNRGLQICVAVPIRLGKVEASTQSPTLK